MCDWICEGRRAVVCFYEENLSTVPCIQPLLLLPVSKVFPSFGMNFAYSFPLFSSPFGHFLSLKSKSFWRSLCGVFLQKSAAYMLALFTSPNSNLCLHELTLNNEAYVALHFLHCTPENTSPHLFSSPQLCAPYFIMFKTIVSYVLSTF